jgi:hypothetical protein
MGISQIFVIITAICGITPAAAQLSYEDLDKALDKKPPAAKKAPEKPPDKPPETPPEDNSKFEATATPAKGKSAAPAQPVNKMSADWMSDYNADVSDAFADYYDRLKKMKPSERSRAGRKKLRKEVFADVDEAYNEMLMKTMGLKTEPKKKSETTAERLEPTKVEPPVAASGAADASTTPVEGKPSPAVEPGSAELVRFK